MDDERPADCLLEAVEELAPVAVAELAQTLGRAGDVDEKHGGQKPLGLDLGGRRAGDELLDRAEEVRLWRGQ
jgi:hypothetical protein